MAAPVNMFSMEEAVDFLQTRWGFVGVEKRLGEDRQNLLNDIVKAGMAKAPFQNVTLMATTPHQRRRPSLEQIKKDCVEGRGGLCYTLNVFAFGLLQALGYDVTLCHATCTATTIMEDNHIFVVVNNLNRHGDHYLVEAGVGFPMFQAVCIDFSEGEESPVYVDSFLEYKYIKHNGRILRMHRKGDTAPRPNPPRPEIDFYIGEWRRFYHSDLKPVFDVSEFDECFDVVYSDPKATNFHVSPRVLCFPEQQAVILATNRLTSERDGVKDAVIQPMGVENDDVIVDCYRKYFPQFGDDVVLAAYREWRRVKD